MAGTPFKVYVPKWKKQIGIVAKSYEHLLVILRDNLRLTAPGFQVSLEDGTLVCGQDYFEVLRPQTRLVVVENSEQSQIVSSTAEHQQSVGQKRRASFDSEHCSSLPKCRRLSSSTLPSANRNSDIHQQQNQLQQQRASPVSSLVISNVSGSVPMALSPPADISGNHHNQHFSLGRAPASNYQQPPPRLQHRAPPPPPLLPSPIHNHQHHVYNHSAQPMMVPMNRQHLHQPQYQAVQPHPRPQYYTHHNRPQLGQHYVHPSQQQRPTVVVQPVTSHRVLPTANRQVSPPHITQLIRPQVIRPLVIHNAHGNHPTLTAQKVLNPCHQVVSNNGRPPVAQTVRTQDTAAAKDPQSQLLVAGSVEINHPTALRRLPDYNQGTPHAPPSSSIQQWQQQHVMESKVANLSNCNHNNSVALNEVERQIDALRFDSLAHVAPIVPDPLPHTIASNSHPPQAVGREGPEHCLKVVTIIDEDTDDTCSVSSEGCLIIDENVERANSSANMEKSQQSARSSSPADPIPPTTVSKDETESTTLSEKHLPPAPALSTCLSELLIDAMEEYLASVGSSDTDPAPQNEPISESPPAPTKSSSDDVSAVEDVSEPLTAPLTEVFTNVSVNSSTTSDTSITMNTCSATSTPEEPLPITSNHHPNDTSSEASIIVQGPFLEASEDTTSSPSPLSSPELSSDDALSSEQSSADLVALQEDQPSPVLDDAEHLHNELMKQTSNEEKPADESVSKQAPQSCSSEELASTLRAMRKQSPTPRKNSPKCRGKIQRCVGGKEELSLSTILQIQQQTANMVRSVKKKIGSTEGNLQSYLVSNLVVEASSSGEISSSGSTKNSRASYGNKQPAFKSIGKTTTKSSLKAEKVRRSTIDSGKRLTIHHSAPSTHTVPPSKKRTMHQDKLKTAESPPYKGGAPSQPTPDQLPFADFTANGEVEVKVLASSSSMLSGHCVEEEMSTEFESSTEQGDTSTTKEALLVSIPFRSGRVVWQDSKLQLPLEPGLEINKDDATSAGSQPEATTPQQDPEQTLIVSLPIVCKSGQLFYETKSEAGSSKPFFPGPCKNEPPSPTTPSPAPCHTSQLTTEHRSSCNYASGFSFLKEFFSLCADEESAISVSDDKDGKTLNDGELSKPLSLQPSCSFEDLSSVAEPDSTQEENTLEVAEFASEETVHTTAKKCVATDVDRCLQEILQLVVETHQQMTPSKEQILSREDIEKLYHESISAKQPSSSPVCSRHRSPTAEDFTSPPPPSPRYFPASPALIAGEVVVGEEDSEPDLLEDLVAQFRVPEETIITELVEMDFECSVIQPALHCPTITLIEPLVDPRLYKRSRYLTAD